MEKRKGVLQQSPGPTGEGNNITGTNRIGQGVRPRIVRKKKGCKVSSKSQLNFQRVEHELFPLKIHFVVDLESLPRRVHDGVPLVHAAVLLGAALQMIYNLRCVCGGTSWLILNASTRHLVHVERERLAASIEREHATHRTRATRGIHRTLRLWPSLAFRKGGRTN